MRKITDEALDRARDDIWHEAEDVRSLIAPAQSLLAEIEARLANYHEGTVEGDSLLDLKGSAEIITEGLARLVKHIDESDPYDRVEGWISAAGELQADFARGV